MKIAPLQGGRLASLRIDGHELLVQDNGDPVAWGCYPMVPFAGRIRRGVLDFDGERYTLPTNDGAHAMHGYGFVEPWHDLGDAEIRLELREPWPFAATVTQRFALSDSRLTLSMTIDAKERQPLSVGWHPWFRRDIGNGSDAELQFAPSVMYRRDEDGLPSGELVTPPPGPWDDCFTDVEGSPTLRWGTLELVLSSSADHWVVYDELSHALCVEPQTGPPNASNDDPWVLEPGERHLMEFTIGW